MLAAAQRLRRSGEFGAVVRAGRRAGRGMIAVHLDLRPTAMHGSAMHGSAQPARAAGAERSAVPVTRAGFVVSKAVGGAVARNLVRRRLRQLTRERLESLPPGATLVVRALPGAAEASYARLGADLDAAIAAARAGRGRGRGSR